MSNFSTSLKSASWTLDHVAHAVQNLENTLAFYSQCFNFKVSIKESIPSQRVEVAFLELENSKIEIIAPLGVNSTVQKFIQKKGEGLHHICFKVPSVKAELVRLKSQGITLIDEIPRTGAHQSSVGFLHPKSCKGVLIELCSY